MDYRLKKQKDFNEIFLKGKRSYSKNITLIFVKAKDLKVGISVSKKNGNSVVRNKLKRLIRASYYPLLKSLKCYHLVLMPKVGVVPSFENFCQDISYLLRKEKLLDEKNSDGDNKVL